MALFSPSVFKTLLIASLWLCLAGVLFYFMNTRVNPNSSDTLAQSGDVVLQRDLSGHYRADAYINGIKTRVMVDTGATDVAISQALADKLGLHSINAIRTRTANGDTVSYMTRLTASNWVASLHMMLPPPSPPLWARKYCWACPSSVEWMYGFIRET